MSPRCLYTGSKGHIIGVQEATDGHSRGKRGISPTNAAKQWETECQPPAALYWRPRSGRESGQSARSAVWYANAGHGKTLCAPGRTLTEGPHRAQEETRGRFESLEVFLRKEIESLTDQLKAEQDARQQAILTLTQELTETAKAFDQRTNQVEEHIVKAQRELRQHILDQSRTLRDEFWDRYRELSEATDRGIQELRAEKTDRATLAVLLTELAMRLGNEYLLPGNE